MITFFSWLILLYQCTSEWLDVSQEAELAKLSSHHFLSSYSCLVLFVFSRHDSEACIGLGLTRKEQVNGSYGNLFICFINYYFFERLGRSIFLLERLSPEWSPCLLSSAGKVPVGHTWAHFKLYASLAFQDQEPSYQWLVKRSPVLSSPGLFELAHVGPAIVTF